MGILLIEKNGQRMVYLPEDDGSIVCEYKSTDSVGAECWKMLRRIPPEIGGLHERPMRPNVMIDFLLEMYKDNIPKQEQQHIKLSMEYRRLEIIP